MAQDRNGVGGLRASWAGPDFDKRILGNPFVVNAEPRPAAEQCPGGGDCAPKNDTQVGGGGGGGGGGDPVLTCSPGRFLIGGLCKLW